MRSKRAVPAALQSITAGCEDDGVEEEQCRDEPNQKRGSDSVEAQLAIPSSAVAPQNGVCKIPRSDCASRVTSLDEPVASTNEGADTTTHALPSIMGPLSSTGDPSSASPFCHAFKDTSASTAAIPEVATTLPEVRAAGCATSTNACDFLPSSNTSRSARPSRPPKNAPSLQGVLSQRVSGRMMSEAEMRWQAACEYSLAEVEARAARLYASRYRE